MLKSIIGFRLSLIMIMIMNYVLKNVIVDWILDSLVLRAENNDDYKWLSQCCSISKEFKQIIYLNPLFERKKSAYMLSSVICETGIDDVEYIHELLQHSRNDYNWILNLIFNIYIKSDSAFQLYLNKKNQYKCDRLDPLCNMKLLNRSRFKKQMSRSIILNMAMDHAEMKFSYIKLRELDDFSY